MTGTRSTGSADSTVLPAAIPAPRSGDHDRPSHADAQLQFNTHARGCKTCRNGDWYCQAGCNLLALTSGTDKHR